MSRSKVSKAEIENRLQGDDDPVRSLPAGFPTTHSRIRPTLSEFVVDAIERVKARGGDDLTPDPKSVERRNAFRAQRAAGSGRQR